MIVELPNGQELEFPDGTSQEVMRNAIHTHFPEYAAMYQPKNAKSQENPTDMNFLEKGLVRYGAQDPAAGLLNMGSRGSASLNNLASQIAEKFGLHLPRQEATDFSEMLGIPEEQKNLADKLIQFAPEIGVSLALPATRLGKLGEAINQIPRGGKYLKTALGNALSQGLFAASQSPDNQGTAAIEAGSVAAPFSALSQGVLSGSPTIRNLSRTLGAIGGGGLGYFGAKGLGFGEPIADIAMALMGAAGHGGLNTKGRVREDVLKGVEGTNYKEALDAANRLGLKYITPAEASENPFTGGVQGNLGKTEGGAQLLYERGKARSASEENAIENLFSNVFPKALEEQKNALYKSAEKIEVPKEKLETLKENEIFKTALNRVRKEPVYKEKLKGIPDNSIGYLNQVKEAMDDMIEKSPRKEASIIRETKNNLLGTLDTVSPAYKEGRQLAERGIVRKEIEDLFNKKDETGSNLFKTLLSNKKDYRELQDRFRRLEKTSSSPEQVKSMKNAQQQLEDMRLIFGRLINIPTAKTAEALSRSSMSKGRAPFDEAIRRFKEVLSGGKYDKTAVELITNPKWADELHKLKEITKGQKLIGAFHNLLGKAGAQAIAQ